MPRAIKLYRESIKVDGGTRWEAHFFLGKVLIGERQYASAAETLRAALKLVPDNAAVQQELSSATARMSLPVDANGQAIELPADEQLTAALGKNLQEHQKESAASCDTFYCADAQAAFAYDPPAMDSLTMGPVPSNDYPHAFDGAAEQIFVSKAPLFTSEECERVISLAEAEGLGMPPAKSGKYAIGRAWIKEMPGVLEWFNTALETRLFPTLHRLFGGLVSHPSQLRAHTVLVAKYNASDSTGRSDVHVDDALLALTIALSPPESFSGGGTYFEHLNRSVDMGQGHVTFRPGSVRHAGAPIDSGVRYVIGAFVAVADKVEHVRRLVERGNRLLLMADAGQAGAEHLQYAAKLFAWGLQLNPRCTLCHQSLGDVLLRLEQPAQAEAAMRKQIALLPREADAHFALGVSLRRQGKNAEAVEAYEHAVALAPDDAEGFVNLGAALGEVNEHAKEASAYRQALALRPGHAVVWMNLAGVLATNLRQPARALAAYRRAASAYAAQPDDGGLRDVAEHFSAAGASLRRAEEAPLAATLQRVAAGAKRLAEAKQVLRDHEGGVCGASCDEIGAAEPTGADDEAAEEANESPRACAMSWEQRCGAAAPPPPGFDEATPIAVLCARACAADALERHASKIDASKVRAG